MASYDPRTALLVVDVQNDFADPRGSLYVKGGEEVVSVINPEIERALSAGSSVFYSQDWHPEGTPHFAKDGGVWPVHCVMGTWGAELRHDLEVRGDVIRKGSGGEDGYSAFSVRDPVSGERESTTLDSLLEAKGVESVVIAGLTTDYCVKETALDALRRGYRTTVLTDAVRAVNLEPGDGDRALAEVKERGGRLE